MLEKVRTQRVGLALPALMALIAACQPRHAQEVTSDHHSTQDLMALSFAPYLQNKRVLSYPYEQVWPTALRFLRLERSYEIKERDKEAGFMTFEFEENGRQVLGSLELLPTQDVAGRRAVQMIINTQNGSAHLPHSILDGIAKKIRVERGQPTAPPPPKKPIAPQTDEPNTSNKQR